MRALHSLSKIFGGGEIKLKYIIEFLGFFTFSDKSWHTPIKQERFNFYLPFSKRTLLRVYLMQFSKFNSRLNIR